MIQPHRALPPGKGRLARATDRSVTVPIVQEVSAEALPCECTEQGGNCAGREARGIATRPAVAGSSFGRGAILGDLALGPPARVARRADAGLIPTQRFCV